jgi:3-dehydroquinate synthase
MKTVEVRSPSAGYRVFLGRGILRSLPQELKKAGVTGKILIVSSPRIFGLHGKKLAGVLKAAGMKDTSVELFPDGEKHKTWESCAGILKELFIFEGGSMKKPAVIAFGGGVVGDVAGFAASIYKRGVHLVNVPTTLLAMVDSSVGGKTGIDFSNGGITVKNMLGTFHQPRLVFADTVFLDTLPASEFRNGIAEIIKYGIIKDRALFGFLEKKAGKTMSGRALLHIIEKSVSIKAGIVGKDECETKGLRYLLNYGHTVGHAVEAASAFRYSHGGAVSIGMLCAAAISVKKGLMSAHDIGRIEGLVRAYGLPVEYSGIKPEEIMTILRYDKKFGGGENRFILPCGIGSAAVVRGVKWSIVREAVAERGGGKT